LITDNLQSACALSHILIAKFYLPRRETRLNLLVEQHVARNAWEPCLQQDITAMQPWPQWQSEIVALLENDFDGALGSISIEDIDWPSWRPLYDQGRTPRSAIERALERDL
jgi:hypothetical protein